MPARNHRSPRGSLVDGGRDAPAPTWEESPAPDDEAAEETPTTHGSRRRRWTSPDGRLQATTHVDSGVAVLTLAGPVDRGALSLGRAGLDAALSVRTPHVVLNLESAVISAESVTVVALLQREAGRHGVSLWLAGLTLPARILLVRGDRSIRRRAFASVPAAVLAANQRPGRRP